MHSKLYINKYLYPLILLLGLLICGLSVLNIEYSLWIVFSICFILVFTVFLKRRILQINEYRVLVLFCIIGFIVRLLLIVISTIYPILTISGDNSVYQAVGLEIANSWHEGHWSFDVNSEHFFYYVCNAVVYYIFGYFPSLLRIINSFIGVFAGINVYFIAKRLFDGNAARVAAFFTIFLPSMIFWQSMNLKESLVILLITLILKNIVLMESKLRLKVVFSTLAYIVLLTITRSYFGIFMGGIFCLYILVNNNLSFPKKLIFLTGIFIIAGIITYKAGMGFMGLKYVNKFSPQYVDLIRRSDYKGGSEVLQEISFKNYQDLMKFLPIGISYFLLSPFPWQAGGSFIQFMATGENMFWYIIYMFLPLGVFLCYKRNKNICTLLLLILSCLIAFYSISMGNMGLAYRYRCMLLPIFSIIAAPGFVKFTQKLSMASSKT